MKNNAHLYWPPSVIEEYMVSVSAPKERTIRHRVPVAVEPLEGGCLLYRLRGYQPTQRFKQDL